MPTTDRPFNVLLTEDHQAMLTALAHKHHCSKGHIVRDAIRFRFAMSLNSTPTCATGQPCLVPALHHVPTAPQSPMPAPEGST